MALEYLPYILACWFYI